MGRPKKIGEIMRQTASDEEDYDEQENAVVIQARKSKGEAESRPSDAMLEAFERTYEPCDSEDIAQERFSMGRLRSFFQAWIVPKMPDPLGAYIDALANRGYNIHPSYDGSMVLFVRHHPCENAVAEEMEDEEYEVEYEDEDLEEDDYEGIAVNVRQSE